LPSNFAASTTETAVAMISNFSPLLTLIIGSLLVVIIIGVLIETIRGH
jgi:hypothetical protein